MFDKKQPSYLALRDIVSEGTRPIVAWVGAGLSAPAGLPLWGGLKKHLCDALEAKSRSVDGDDRARAEAQLTLAKSLCEKSLSCITEPLCLLLRDRRQPA
jgi:hypothetical protein